MVTFERRAGDRLAEVNRCLAFQLSKSSARLVEYEAVEDELAKTVGRTVVEHVRLLAETCEHQQEAIDHYQSKSEDLERKVAALQRGLDRDVMANECGTQTDGDLPRFQSRFGQNKMADYLVADEFLSNDVNIMNCSISTDTSGFDEISCISDVLMESMQSTLSSSDFKGGGEFLREAPTGDDVSAVPHSRGSDEVVGMVKVVVTSSPNQGCDDVVMVVVDGGVTTSENAGAPSVMVPFGDIETEPVVDGGSLDGEVLCLLCKETELRWVQKVETLEQLLRKTVYNEQLARDQLALCNEENDRRIRALQTQIDAMEMNEGRVDDVVQMLAEMERRIAGSRRCVDKLGRKSRDETKETVDNPAEVEGPAESGEPGSEISTSKPDAGGTEVGKDFGDSRSQDVGTSDTTIMELRKSVEMLRRDQKFLDCLTRRFQPLHAVKVQGTSSEESCEPAENEELDRSCANAVEKCSISKAATVGDADSLGEAVDQTMSIRWHQRSLSDSLVGDGEPIEFDPSHLVDFECAKRSRHFTPLTDIDTNLKWMRQFSSLSSPGAGPARDTTAAILSERNYELELTTHHLSQQVSSRLSTNSYFVIIWCVCHDADRKSLTVLMMFIMCSFVSLPRHV